jgi:hypothetical protein
MAGAEWRAVSCAEREGKWGGSCEACARERGVVAGENEKKKGGVVARVGRKEKEKERGMG